jgi:hypothetical protein
MRIFCFLLFAVTTFALPTVVSGPWYYIADGLDGTHAYDPIPTWMNNAGNVISLAFLNPKDFGVRDPVPQAYKDATTYFKGKNKTVFFSIGGYAYISDWTWLTDKNAATQAGSAAADIAKQYGVGIEIDYEGWQDPAGTTGQIGSFISAFRSKCPMGTCLLTTDLYGSPGGVDWQRSYVSSFLPPTGKPGTTYGNGNFNDWVNIMVIDGQQVSGCEMYWQQWFDTGVLNANRATFGLVAGGTSGGGICSGNSTAQGQINQAWSFLKPHNVYGILSWAVCPQSSCGDWDKSCDSNAPGFQYLCTQLGSC